ncbi:MAG: hydrogenase [Bacteroidetes bacterium QS_1_63_11]|nr:MAG: hydrogenase [Bacteroidetes bacterium QS_1_63_11]
MIELDVINSETADREESGPTFWRHSSGSSSGADEGGDDLTEFVPGDSEPPSGASRRQFLQLMGAAMAMAGLAGCRRPEEKILPYSHDQETVMPGVADHYATGMPFRGVLRPVVAESNEGRPTKIKGNGDHPAGQTGTSPYEQASVLNLYDPDRSRSVRQDGSTASWGDFVSFCRQLGNEAERRQVAVLVEESDSPTLQAMRQRMEDRFPNLKWLSYSATGDDTRRLGMQQAFGRSLRPRYELGAAEVIVSLDANFLDGRARDFAHNTQAFAEGRRLKGVEDTMSRLYTVESRYSTTGGSSDHRLGMRAGRISAVAAALAAELGVGGAPDASWSEKERLHVREMVRDLQDAGENGVVMAGPSQPPEVHALSMAINQQLGAFGTTVTLFDTGESSIQSQGEALAGLTASMKQGAVDTLFMLGVNPVYDAPADLDFEAALSNVRDSVHLGRLRNETAQAARWHLPRAHYLEQWGDGRAYDGTLSVIQPLIQPLYDDAHSTIEVLNLAATGVDASGHDLVREQWRSRLSGPFQERWRRVLHDGYLEDSGYDVASVGAPTVPSVEAPAADTEELEVVFRPDSKLLTGRFSNNPWMQELPDPITKIVWDNVAVMSQATADELGVEVQRREGNFYADRVELTVNGQTAELPVWIQPGYPDGSIGVSMGYGRTIASTRESESTPFWDTSDQTNIYNGSPIAGGVDVSGNGVDVVGANVAPMRPISGRVTTGAEVNKVDSGYLIATTQEEGSMQGRPIVRWATLEEFKENPQFVNDEQPPVPELGHEGDGHGEGHGGGEHGSGGHGEGGSHGGENDHSDGNDHSGDGTAHDVSDQGLEAGPGADAHGADDMPAQAAHGGDGAVQEGGGGSDEAEPVEQQQEYPMVWEEDHPKDQQKYKNNPYYQNQWGMTVDLNTCTGCNACVVACTSENNVQVVGKEEVSNGRHMYWIRNDRYYVSEEEGDDDPEMLTQPVMCQHCENAPCESVCPVAATVHSPDGTNQMVYNRCIGTRYCQNNCPYKVRRFNFYDWTKTLPTEVQMAQNPDVTVRTRGVMEKCTWCVHRVRKHQQKADNEDRTLRPDEVETACQEACPTDAITFGDLNNPESKVVEKKKNPRRYELLSYLNTKPRLSYLGRVRNTNPRLEEALSLGTEAEGEAHSDA